MFVHTLINRVTKKFLGLGLALACFLAAADASAAVADMWLRTGGHFSNLGGGRWQEIINGKIAFKFTENGRSTNEVSLFDASRNITVKLTPTQALVYKGTAKVLTYNGSWRFTLFAYTGGEFRDKALGRFEEWQGGRKVFDFREVRRAGGIVYLYDASRGYNVQITQTAFHVSNNADPAAKGYTRNGRWVR